MNENKRSPFLTMQTHSNFLEKSASIKMNEPAKPSIPTLTDIMPVPEKKQPVAEQKPSPSFPALLSDESLWNELEERLTNRIHKQVTERLNFVLDENLEQHVSTILEQVVTLLANEMKHDLQKTLEVFITHAVSTELQRIKKELSSDKK